MFNPSLMFRVTGRLKARAPYMRKDFLFNKMEMNLFKDLDSLLKKSSYDKCIVIERIEYDEGALQKKYRVLTYKKE